MDRNLEHMIVSKQADQRKLEDPEYSKKLLIDAIETKMKTIMIGSLDSIEKKLGVFAGKDKKGQLTPAEKVIADLLQEIRGEILDKGNKQIRNMKEEMKSYTIRWHRHYLKMPILKKNKEG